MFCKKCGNEINEGQKFCVKCGTPVPDKGMEQNVNVIQKSAVKPVKEKSEATRNNILLIVFFILLTIVIFGVVVLIGLKSNKDTAENKTITEELTKEETEEETTEEVTTEATTEEVTTEEVTTEAALPFTLENVAMAEASSSLSEYNMTHFPNRLTDGDYTTGWVEGAAGQGVGEFVKFTFDNDFTFNGVTVYAGYHKNADIYEKNSRPKDLRITFSDGSSKVYPLEDVMEGQKIVFDAPVTTRFMMFTIESVYPGSKYEDTVITEILFN